MNKKEFFKSFLAITLGIASSIIVYSTSKPNHLSAQESPNQKIISARLQEGLGREVKFGPGSF